MFYLYSMQAVILITVVMPENILHIPIQKFSYAEKNGIFIA